MPKQGKHLNIDQDIEPDVIFHSDEPLWGKYRRIGTLHLPEEACVESAGWESPFASYEQRGFVCAQTTKCLKVEVAEIDNLSKNMILQEEVLYSKDMTRLIFCFEEKEEFVVPDTVKRIDAFRFLPSEKAQEYNVARRNQYYRSGGVHGMRVFGDIHCAAVCYGNIQ